MIEITNDKPETMHAEWVLTNVCNYKCSYCDPRLNEGTHRWPSLNDSLRFWNYVHKEVNQNHKMLTLTGGEPTLWPNLIPFLQGLDSSYETAIVSNGSRTLKYWDRLVNSVNLTQITISVHFEYADFKHLFSVIDIIGTASCLTVLIMYDIKNIQVSKEFAEKVKDLNLPCRLMIKPITDRTYIKDNKSIEYTLQQKQFIQEFYYNNQNKSRYNIYNFRSFTRVY